MGLDDGRTDGRQDDLGCGRVRVRVCVSCWRSLGAVRVVEDCIDHIPFRDGLTWAGLDWAGLDCLSRWCGRLLTFIFLLSLSTITVVMITVSFHIS